MSLFSSEEDDDMSSEEMNMMWDYMMKSYTDPAANKKRMLEEEQKMKDAKMIAAKILLSKARQDETLYTDGEIGLYCNSTMFDSSIKTLNMSLGNISLGNTKYISLISNIGMKEVIIKTEKEQFILNTDDPIIQLQMLSNGYVRISDKTLPGYYNGIDESLKIKYHQNFDKKLFNEALKYDYYDNIKII